MNLHLAWLMWAMAACLDPRAIDCAINGPSYRLVVERVVPTDTAWEVDGVFQRRGRGCHFVVVVDANRCVLEAEGCGLRGPTRSPLCD